MEGEKLQNEERPSTKMGIFYREKAKAFHAAKINQEKWLSLLWKYSSLIRLCIKQKNEAEIHSKTPIPSVTITVF